MKNSGAGARNIIRDYNNGWLTKVREGSTSWGSLTYHPNGMLDTVTHLNGVESRYGLDPQKMQRPASVAAVYGATTYWNSGSYAYDGSGNVKTIGADYFYYDGVQRLVEGTSERVSSSVYKRQRQSYDVYGNITNIATTINGSTSNRPISVDAVTNRLNATNYDPAGNQTSWDGIYTYGYDSLGMMVSQQGGNRDILYFYTADDERIWEYDHNANRSDYTIRDLDKKVLRVFDENIGVWIWKKDMIGRGSAALASMSYGGALHYTVDHLGTPRYISDAARAQIGRHAYYPFGQESTSDTQNQEFAKFTGHERDTNFTNTLDYLDYMHARYYNPMLGRFLGVDPVLNIDRAMYRPQNWTRYSYVMNNPVRSIDPDGRDVQDWLRRMRDGVIASHSHFNRANAAAGQIPIARLSVGDRLYGTKFNAGPLKAEVRVDGRLRTDPNATTTIGIRAIGSAGVAGSPVQAAGRVSANMQVAQDRRLIGPTIPDVSVDATFGTRSNAIRGSLGELSWQGSVPGASLELGVNFQKAGEALGELGAAMSILVQSATPVKSTEDDWSN